VKPPSPAEQWLIDHGARAVAPLPVDVLSAEQATRLAAWAATGFGDHAAWVACEAALTADRAAAVRLLAHDATWDAGELPGWDEDACEALPPRERGKLRNRHADIFTHQHTRARVIGLLAPIVAGDPGRAQLLRRLSPPTPPGLRAALAAVWLAGTPTADELDACRAWVDEPAAELIAGCVLAELIVDADAAAERLAAPLAAAFADPEGMRATIFVGALSRLQSRLTSRWANRLLPYTGHAMMGGYVAAIAARLPGAPAAALDALIAAALAGIEIGVVPKPIAEAVLALQTGDSRIAPVLEYLLGAPHVAHRPQVVAAIRALGEPRLLALVTD